MWVFGYGSLMWNPGFAFEQARRARIFGHHRALCVYSVVHRGTRERPGLVFGLDRGGTTEGMAFFVAPADAREVLAYLQAREQVTGVYRQKRVHLELLGTGAEGPCHVHAIAFVVDPTHRQYAGRLPLDVQHAIVSASVGGSGANTDYVLATARHLAECGVRDRSLERLVARLASSPRGLAVRRGDDGGGGSWAHRMLRLSTPSWARPRPLRGLAEIKANYRRRIERR